MSACALPPLNLNGAMLNGSAERYNEPGTRGDCGFQVTTTAGCPGEIACSGHGICDESNFTCDCNDGWTAGDCSLRSCPYGWSWFSYPRFV